MNYLLLFLTMSYIPYSFAETVEECSYNAARLALSVKIHAMVAQAASDEGQKIVGNGGSIESRYDPKIKKEAVCSKQYSDDFEKMGQQKMLSVKLINKSLKSTGKVDPVLLNGLIESETALTEKKFCSTINQKMAKELNNICSEDSKCASKCATYFNGLKNNSFEEMNYKKACERIFDAVRGYDNELVKCYDQKSPIEDKESQTKNNNHENNSTRSNPYNSPNINVRKRAKIMKDYKPQPPSTQSSRSLSQ